MSGSSFPFMAKLKRPNRGADPAKYIQEEMFQNLKAIEDALKRASQANYAITPNCGVFDVPTITGLSLVTNLSTPFTVRKNPVRIELVVNDFFENYAGMGGGAGFIIAAFRDEVKKAHISILPTGPKAPIVWFDNPGPGSYTYSIRAGATGTSGASIGFVNLLVTEL